MCAKESESVHNATGGMEAVFVRLSFPSLALSPLRSVIEKSEKKRDNLREEEVTESP